METEAEQPSVDSEIKGTIETITINPGNFKVVTFSPETFANFNAYREPSPPQPFHFHSNLHDQVKTYRKDHVHRYVFRSKRIADTRISKNSIRNIRKLLFAATTCNVELLADMLEDGMDPNSCDQHKRSALHLAACRGYTNIIAILLQKKANPNVKDSLGNTPLHLAVISACSKKYIDVVRILLNYKASVHSTDRAGKGNLLLVHLF